MLTCLPEQQVFNEEDYDISIPTRQCTSYITTSYKVKNKTAVKNVKFLDLTGF